MLTAEEAKLGNCRESTTDIQKRCASTKAPEIVLADYAGAPLWPHGIKLSSRAQTTLSELVGGIYQGHYRSHQHLELSVNDEAAFLKDGSSKGADCYGEIMPEGFLELLWSVGERPGCRFYDLGAGTGKLPALAWFMGMRATGVELCSGRWQAACDAVDKLEAMSAAGRLPSGGHECASGLPQRLPFGLDYICRSMFDVDFSDADLVLVSTVMFTQTMVSKIAHLARYMKPGSKVISYHNFGKLPKLGSAGIMPEFQERGVCHVATSWNLRTCWQVQEVVPGHTELDQLPSHLQAASEFGLQCRTCDC